jgi:hypothetical protein
LRRQALAVQRYVQDHAHQSVDCELQSGLLQSKGLFSFATMDPGYPEIVLDQAVGVNETQVTHELFHLKLDVDGSSFRWCDRDHAVHLIELILT